MFGHITILIEGNNATNLINLAAKSNINLWGIGFIYDDSNEVNKKKLLVNTLSSEYKNLLKISKKIYLKLKIIEKHGFPFIYEKHKDRKGILIGIVIFILNIHVLSFYIWKINVIGAKDLSVQKVISAANELGIHPGALSNKINVKHINQKLMANLPEVSWISVNLEGCIANIVLKEKIKTPEIISDDFLPQVLQAAYDGQIVGIETYKGYAVVSIGDSVVKGQILISSESSEGIDNKKSCSDGKVWACVWHEIIEKQPLIEIKKTETNNKCKIYHVWLLGKEIPINFWLNPSQGWEKSEDIKFLKILNSEFPIAIKTDNYTEFQEIQTNLTNEEAFEIAKSNAKKRLEKEIESKILEQETKQEIKNGEAIFTIRAKCLENIAIKIE
jgi:similar to stage IV sporulation protein